ncbi:16762_t:CDS:1, partial [Funneliformis geosporum]
INSSPMVLLELLKDIATAIDCVKLYIDGNRSFDPKNTLNDIRIILTTIRTHMQRVSNDALYYQGLLNMANRQVNNLMNDIVY